MSLILDGTNGLSDIDGTAATPAIRGTDTNTGIFFPAADTIAFSEGGVESMRIDSAGNLGIGTTSPTSYTNLRTVAISGTNGGVVDINPSGGTTAGGLQLVARATDTTFVANGPSGGSGAFMAFATGASGAAAERMRIDSSGNLLVNRTSQIASEQLGVGFDGAAKQGIYITDTSAAATVTMMGFYKAGAARGSITSTSTATSYLTSSDYRLKENIAPMTGALAAVSALKPVTYKWKVDGSNGQGFIAHELQEVVPDCVIGEKDAVDEDGNIKPQGIDTSFLVATLAAAIQELKATVDAQAARIAALEAAV